MRAYAFNEICTRYNNNMVMSATKRIQCRRLPAKSYSNVRLLYAREFFFKFIFIHTCIFITITIWIYYNNVRRFFMYTLHKNRFDTVKTAKTVVGYDNYTTGIPRIGMISFAKRDWNRFINREVLSSKMW